ncbi:MAG: exo-alpha-sialidase [SAR202 cluster bacterium]|nr:exo-alpha-sialidase [SAR202 cluster bacterium]|tara:strand:+ start:3897 stop:5000 length:1104 start_codon:yes stop_codon:yes gene_type:complete
MKILNSGIISKNKNIGAYKPMIIPLENNTWLACQNSSKTISSPDSFIETLISYDAGINWQNNGSIHKNHSEKLDWAYRGPQISKMSNNKLFMRATRFETSKINETFDSNTKSTQTGELISYWSSDLGKTWTEPSIVDIKELPTDKFTYNTAGKVLHINNNLLIYPIETGKPVGSKGDLDQKAGIIFSYDNGKSWQDFTVVADDPTGEFLYWDQTGTILNNGDIYIMFWVHNLNKFEDLTNHYVLSKDMGKTWSKPKPTNLQGQACAPIALNNGNIATLYTKRHGKQGIYLAITDDLSHYDIKNELQIFDAGHEGILGTPIERDVFSINLAQGFGKPGGSLLENGQILLHYWGTKNSISQTMWATVNP